MTHETFENPTSEKAAIAPAALCKLCLSGDRVGSVVAREMHSGLRTTFEYSSCARCGSLQIADQPQDMAPYYGGQYYSMAPPQDWLARRPGLLSRWLRSKRSTYALTGKGLVGRIAMQTIGPPLIPYGSPWFRAANALPESCILDFGCGTGTLLYRLRREGFGQLQGYDPFVATPVSEPGFAISSDWPQHLTGACDLVMAHHSLEHIADPAAALRRLAPLLKTEGRLLVRVPLSDSEAYRRYGADWVQLDAPRHLFLATRDGMKLLLDRCGFELLATKDDSSAFQFWGSEQYLRDVPLSDRARSWSFPENRASQEARRQIDEFEKQAAQLNAEGRGDQAWFLARLAR